MKQLDLKIVSDRQRKLVRKRRRRSLVLGLLLAVAFGVGQWQLQLEEERLGSALAPAALLEAAIREPWEDPGRSRGVTVAEYAERRRTFLGREAVRPLGAPPLGSHEGAATEETALSSEDRAAVLSPPLLPR
jgi:hypothetical protein